MILPLVLLLAASSAQAADAGTGYRLAYDKCGKCHAVQRVGRGPDTGAPKFRGFANTTLKAPLPVMLRRATAKKHGGAPPIPLTPEEIENLATHIESLKFY